MKILIFGGQGRTGKLVAQKALSLGHTVSVFVFHNNHSLPNNIAVIEGDARDPANVKKALVGQDAIINIIAPRLFDHKNYDISEIATRNIIESMQAAGIRRYIGQSGAWATENITEASLPLRIGFWILPMFHSIYVYKKREDQIVKNSGLDWTLVRCGILSDRDDNRETYVARDGHYRCKPFEIPTISRQNVANFHLDILQDSDYFRSSPVIVATKQSSLKK